RVSRRRRACALPRCRPAGPGRGVRGQCLRYRPADDGCHTAGGQHGGGTGGGCAGHPPSAPPPSGPRAVAARQLGSVSITATRSDVLISALRRATYTSWGVTGVFSPLPRVISTPSNVWPYSFFRAPRSGLSTSLPLTASTRRNFHSE